MWLPHLYYVIHSGVCCNVVHVVWHMFHSVQILYCKTHGLVFSTVLNAWCLVPGFGTWFIDLTAQNDLISDLAWCMVFGTEIVHSILILTRL